MEVNLVDDLLRLLGIGCKIMKWEEWEVFCYRKSRAMNLATLDSLERVPHDRWEYIGPIKSTNRKYYYEYSNKKSGGSVSSQFGSI